MNSSAAGMSPWKRSGSATAGSACFPRSPASTRKRSAAGGRNWRRAWPTDQPSAYVSREAGVRPLKKRLGNRPGAGGARGAGNSRGSAERAEVGAQQPAPIERTVGSSGPRGEPAYGRSPVARSEVLPASERQERGGRGPPGPRRAVCVSPAAEGGVPVGETAGDQRGHEEERADRQLRQRGAGLVSGSGAR